MWVPRFPWGDGAPQSTPGNAWRHSSSWSHLGEGRLAWRGWRPGLCSLHQTTTLPPSSRHPGLETPLAPLCSPRQPRAWAEGPRGSATPSVQTRPDGRAGQPSSSCGGSSACPGGPPLLPAQLPHLSPRTRTFLDSLTFNYYLPSACLCWLRATYISIKIQFMPIITDSCTSALTRSLPFADETPQPVAGLQ